MPNIFFDNLHLWQKQTDIDYFTHFMKTWLVFNAWMYHSTGSEKDRDNINYVKNENNTFRAKMLSFIRLNDSDSNKFREHIGNLKLTLERNILTNRGEELKFTNAYIENNSLRVATLNFQSCDFKVEFTNPNGQNHQVTILRGTTSILNITNNTYDINWLISHPDFVALSNIRQSKIKWCYGEVNPKIYKNLLTEDDENSIKCGTLHFVNDDTLLCKGLIEMLYRLRCILFHGELVPSAESQKIYEHAYFILKMIIDRL